MSEINDLPREGISLILNFVVIDAQCVKSRVLTESFGLVEGAYGECDDWVSTD